MTTTNLHSTTHGTHRAFGSSDVGAVGLGLMGLTWRPTSTSDEQAFEVIKTAVDNGSNFLNAGEFYNRPDDELANIKLLRRFYEKYPEYAAKTVLSVKGCVSEKTFAIDVSDAAIRRSVDRVLEALGGVKSLDLFQPARLDRNVPIEDVMRTMSELIKEGKFKYIGLSEVSAETIRRAQKIHPITAVEVEYSLFSCDPEVNGVLDACKELNIVLVAYSPVARGFLTGEIKTPDDLPDGDIRKSLDRFQPGNFEENLKLVELVQKQAEKKGVTPAQLSIAWIKTQSHNIVPIPGSTTPSRALENSRSADITFTQMEYEEIRKMIDSFQVKGGRYNQHMSAHLDI